MGSLRQILFLQGLPGLFFNDLAAALRAEGHGVHRVNFNGGDWLSWRFAGVNYRGSLSDWPAFLARILMRRGITDVVLFGDCRPLHRMARATAAGLGVSVHVFEEGYLRPDFITLERGGVNGFSHLPADPAWYQRAAAAMPPVEARPALPEAFPHRFHAALTYYAAVLALSWSFPRGRTHRPWHPLVEAGGWLVKLATRRRAVRRSANEARRLREASYFVLPLQLDSDYQLRAHSDFDGMQPALAHVVASFARCAPADTLLVVKEHPLDNGLTAWRRQTLDYARALGIEQRIVFLEVSDINLLVRAARGVVTVNSTTGTLALAAGVPVFILGRAVYDMPGLTHQGPLDGFWSTPQGPRPELYEAFSRVLVHTRLLHGGFYDLSTRPALIAACVDRILSAELGEATAKACAAPLDAAGGRRSIPARARRFPSPVPAFDEALASRFASLP